MANYLAYTLIGIFFILAIVKPRWSILLYIGSLGWVPAAIGQDIYGRLDFEDITLFLVGVAGLRILVVSPRMCWTTATKILTVYWMFSLVGNFVGVSKDPTLSATIARQMAKDVSLLFLFSGLSGCLRDLRFFRKTVLAMLIATIGVVLSVYVGRFFPNLAITRFWITIQFTVDRSAGALVQPYLAGAYLVVGISLVLAFYFYSKSAWKKFIAPGASLAYGIALLFGQSRASYLGAGIVLLMAMFSRVRNFVWGILLLGVMLVVIGSEPILLERLVGRFKGHQVSQLGGRVESWSKWLGVMDGESWVLGNGFQYSAIKSGIGGHSSYLEIWSDAGIGGLIAFLAFWPAVFRARKHIALSPLNDRDKGAGLAFCWCAVSFLVSSMMIGFLTDTYYRTVFLAVLTLALAPCLTAMRPAPRSAPPYGVVRRATR